MKSESVFMSEVMQTLDEGTTAIGTILREQKELEAKKTDKKLTRDYINEFIIPKINSKRADVSREQDRIMREIENKVEQQAQEYKLIDAIKGEELDDSTLKLLSLGLLEEEELTNLFDSFRGNPTMQKLILRHAEKSGFNIGRVFAGHKEQIEGLNRLKSIVRLYVTNWSDKENARDMLNKLFNP